MKTLQKLLKLKQENKNAPSSLQDFTKQILTTFTLPFWFHVITTSPCINRTRNKPLAQLTLMLEYRGLSRFGIEILAACKVATHTSTHDRIRDTRLLIYDNENNIFSKKALLSSLLIITVISTGPPRLI